MVKELELKHIAPYLPYGLKYKSIDNGSINELLELSFDADFTGWMKPILRPLSQLTPKEYWRLSGKDFKLTFGFYYNRYNGNNDKREFIYHEGYTSRRFFLNEGVETWPYHMMKFFFEHHFDVFGLIPSGLAIEKGASE